MTNYPAQQRAHAPAANQPFGLRSWLAWVAAVTIGWAIGWALVEIVYRVSADMIWLAFLFQGAHVVGIGAAVLQALVLRRHLQRAATWILATGVAAVVSEVIATYVTVAAYERTGEIDAGFLTSIALTIVAGGFLVGIAQWLILRRIVDRAGWWIPVSGLGLIVAWSLGALVGTVVVEDMLRFKDDIRAFNLVAELVGAIIYAAITGYALTRLFRSPSR